MTMNVLEISKLPGVKDLPLKVRAKFAKALAAENDGRHDDAEIALAEAVAIEADLDK